MSNHFIFKLENEIKNYSWGSLNALEKLFNYKNQFNKPQAELWMGTHPAGGSKIKNAQNSEKSLADLIASNPSFYLGVPVCRYNSTLPFLFKILAAEKPLSIQVHPNKKQAESGFKKENEAHIALSAAERNYKDDNHKPELVYALTEFEALNGFRPIAEIIANFRSFPVPVLDDALRTLSKEKTPAQLEKIFKLLLTLPAPKKIQAITELLTTIQTSSHPLAGTIASIAAQYTNDIGIFMPLILNYIKLNKGNAMYLNANTPHAYLKGTALEIMASSDNVLRAGLTPKHIDIPELLKITKFESKPGETLLTQPQQKQNQLFFPVPAKDFQFSIVDSELTPSNQAISGAEILLCLTGIITINTAEDCCTIHPGESVFIAAAAGSYTYSGKGQFARAFC